MAIATRQRVLDTARQLIDKRGYDGFSIAELVSASGVSNGSLYHHFGTKDGVLGALLLSAVEDYQNTILAVLDRHPDDPQAGIRAVVVTHLRWTEGHWSEARLLLEYRNVVTAQPYRRQLQSLNQVFLRRNSSWLRPHVQAGRLPEVDVDAAHAMVFAPAQELCRRWIMQRSAKRPTGFADVLSAGAWAAMSAAK